MTITEFLNARLDEDEAAAHACSDAPWELLPEARQVNVSAEAIRNEKWKYGRMGYVASFEHVENARHVARHNPARVLAEIQAKRRIVEMYGQAVAIDSVLDLLAQVYSGHPDFEEEWRI